MKSFSDFFQIGSLCFLLSIFFPSHFQVLAGGGMTYINLWMFGLVTNYGNMGNIGTIFQFIFDSSLNSFVLANTWRLICILIMLILGISVILFLITSRVKNPKILNKKLLLGSWFILLLVFLAYMVSFTIYFIPSFGAVCFIAGLIYYYKGIKNMQ
jgi:hypothetical protein